MKNRNLKSMMPYIILNTLIHAVIGAIIGKVTVELFCTKKIIDKDYEALKKFLKDMGGRATHIKINDLDESEVPEDILEAAEEAELKEELGETLVSLSETCGNSMSLEDFLKR